MIQIIHQLCQDAECQPQDLAVEWTPAGGARLVATNPKGAKRYLNVMARLDHIAQAICLCANGQEHLYPRIQQQQAVIDAHVKEWTAENTDESDGGGEDSEHTKNNRKDWRKLNTVAGIMRAFPRHPSADDIIDLYQRNKNLKSPDLKSLLEKRSR
jgi:hypothetical protein